MITGCREIKTVDKNEMIIMTKNRILADEPEVFLKYLSINQKLLAIKTVLSSVLPC
jgi:hypothetical protein